MTRASIRFVRSLLRRWMDCTATRACPSCASLCAASRVNPTCGVKPGNDDLNVAPTCDMFSLSQPFEQRRNVDLVGLVVAGERVHHDVDAGAEREFALTRLGGDERQHGLAVLAHRPGAGEIVGGDDD